MTLEEAHQRIINNDNAHAVIEDIFESIEGPICVLCKNCIYWESQFLIHGRKVGYRKKMKSCTYLSINTSQYFGCIQGKAK